MLPPPTTAATSTPSPCTSWMARASAVTRSGSCPYSRAPMSASPDSFSRTRRYTARSRTAPSGSGAAVELTRRSPLPDHEAREALDLDVLPGLGRQLRAHVLDG